MIVVIANQKKREDIKSERCYLINIVCIWITSKIMIDHGEVDQPWFWPNFACLDCFQNHDRIDYDKKKSW